MPKCVKCDQYLHPDWMIEIDEATKACRCVYCHTDKTEITIENEETGEIIERVPKREAVMRYKKYLKDLTEDEKIKKVMMAGQDNPFAM